MRNRQKNTSAALIRHQYYKLLYVQIFTILVNTLNVIIDSIIISQALGTDAMAAIGLFAPVTSMLGLSYVLITGIQIICANLLGKGDTDKISRLFSAGIIFLSTAGFLLSGIFIFCSHGIASLLGASGNAKELLSQYVSGYSFGISAQLLSGLVIACLPLNNDNRYSYFGITTAIVSNIALDLLLCYVIKLGPLGIGIATSCSYIFSVAVMFVSFLNKNKVVYFSFRKPLFCHLPKAARLGLPSILFNVGCTIKAYVLNVLLLSTGNIAAVAAMSVQNTLCSFLGAIPCGAAGAVGILCSIYYGEEDPFSIRLLQKQALRSVVAITFTLTILLITGSSVIPTIFYVPHSPAWEITRRMLLIYPLFLVGNSIYCILQKFYHCQGKTGYVSFLSFFENICIAATAALCVPLFGVDGAWIAFPLTSLLCLILLSSRVIIRQKKLALSIHDWLLLDADFGAHECDRMDLCITALDGVMCISKGIIDFCKSKGIDHRRSMFAGLCIEEMCSNIVQHGFTDGKQHHIDVRITHSHGTLTIRLRDNCRAFNPVKYVSQINTTDPVKNIGIRIVMKIAVQVSYINNLGLNVLLIKI